MSEEPQHEAPQRPKQKTPQARKTTQAEDNPSGRQPKRKTTQAQKTPATPTAATTATSTGALHPLRGGAPVTWRCTRTEEVHCLRIGCSAPTNKNKRGTGTPNHSPPHPSMRTWALLAAGWARRPRHHLHSGPLRPTPTPPTPLNAKSPFHAHVNPIGGSVGGVPILPLAVPSSAWRGVRSLLCRCGAIRPRVGARAGCGGEWIGVVSSAFVLVCWGTAPDP